MTLTAREAMQALLDGKIVTGFNTKWKLNGSGELIVKGIDGWNPSGNDLNHITGVVEEYPLTFEEALRAMLDGKVVECEATSILRQRFCNGQFEYMSISGSNWGLSEYLREKEQKAKWKVVE